MPPRSPAPDAPAPVVRDAPDDLGTVRALAHLLDGAIRIPGTNLRFGLDAVLGLVPGVGDVAGAALSGVVILAAARHGVGAAVLLRMLLNVAIDMVVGAVPVLGDLFDVAFRASARNLALLERTLADPAPARRASALVVGGVVAGFLALVGLGVWLTVRVVAALL